MHSYIGMLEKNAIEQRLLKKLSTKSGLNSFALAFYFIRVGFVRINFQIGARCPCDELYWRPMAQNLWEELGAGDTKSHNQLYRNFLTSIDLQEPLSTPEPEFAKRFNAGWHDIALRSSLVEAICSLAVYEELDVPDYSMLLKVLSDVSSCEVDLKFFRIHSDVDHFSMFTSFLESQNAIELEETLTIVKKRVYSLQLEMWNGMIEYLDKLENK